MNEESSCDNHYRFFGGGFSIRFDSIRFEKQEARMMIDDAHAAVVVIIVTH